MNATSPSPLMYAVSLPSADAFLGRLNQTLAGDVEGQAEEQAHRQKIGALAERLWRDAVSAGGSHSSELLGMLREGLQQIEVELLPDTDPPVCAEEWLATDEPLPPEHVPALFEGGDRVCITGQSKARKSFLAMQLAVAVASGTPFLYFEAGPSRTVLLVNFELKKARYKRRLRKMLAGLGLARKAIRTLHVWNAASQPPGVALWAAIQREAEHTGAEVVIVDPLYRTFEGDESDPHLVKQIVAIMTALCASDRALVYVHHAPKGRAGDRQAIDRGSGSGIWVRDVSTLLSIVEHQQEGLLVCETVTRDHPPRAAESIRFDNEAGCFHHVTGMSPAIKTTASAARAKAVPPDSARVAAAVSEPMLYGPLRDCLRQRLAIAKGVAEQAIAAAVTAGALESRPARGKHGTYYGRPGSFTNSPDAPWSVSS